MSKIVKFQLSDRLNDELAGIIKHQRTSKPFKDYHAVDSSKLIIECLQYAYKLKNFGIPSNESLNFDQKEISKLIHQKYKFYTEYDIKLVFKLGAIGEFKKENEINNLSIEVVYNWFKRYDEEKRRIAIAEQRRFEDAQDKIRSEEEIRKGIQWQYQLYIDLSNGTKKLDSEPYANIDRIFEWLKERKFFELSNDEYQDISLSGDAMYVMMQEQNEEPLKFTPKQLMRKMALVQVFTKWKQQGKKLVIDNEQLKLV
jgi:hypothetical protein